MSEGIERLPGTVAAIEAGFGAGLHLGAQVFVSRDGETLADFALGEARRGQPMETDTLLPWQSATKPFVAVTAGRLRERGRLEWNDPVAKTIPEFAANGKAGVTLEHILTHTAGFRNVEVHAAPATWEEDLERLCNAPLEPGWEPGGKAGYHAASSWVLLAEVLRRLDGRPIEEQVREDILRPLGMDDSWLAMPPDAYHAYDSRIGPVYDTSGGGAVERDEDAEAAAMVRPGSGGRGPARELARLYEALMAGGTRDGARILQTETVEAMTARRRSGMFDHTFQCVVDWGLGFHVDSKRHDPRNFPYGFGPHASQSAYGHGGRQSVQAFCDPEHRLAVAIVVNGMPGEQAHNRRFRAILAALYADLGLAS